MVMGFRERRLGCRLYVDRQSDANILKKLDRMLVDGSFPIRSFQCWIFQLLRMRFGIQ